MVLTSTILIATFFPLKISAVSLKKVVYDKANSLIQYIGKTNMSAINHNSTQMINATSSTIQQEVHKPSSPKSQQEIQKEKQEIQKSKSNITVFTQKFPGLG
jgi:hypothetical protein